MIQIYCKNTPLRIIITTGDTDGIGLEVTLKALIELVDRLKKTQVFMVMHPKGLEFKNFLVLIKKLKVLYNCQILNGFEEVDQLLSSQATANFPQSGKENSSKNLLYFVIDSRNPARWVEDAAYYCMQKLFLGMVTGPISKQTILKAGLKDIGHTDILKRICKISNCHMAFLGKHFKVLLATGHIPLSEVSNSISVATLNDALESCKGLWELLDRNSQKKPIGLLGLNPHAGDQGLIGKEESQVLERWLDVQQKNKSSLLKFKGPLVPDAAFINRSYKNYAFYLALYHDQGLIPFKLIHGFSGTHITVGIPFIRTSVDHGTAQDIFDKNIANPTSMMDSILWCLKLSKRSR